MQKKKKVEYEALTTLKSVLIVVLLRVLTNKLA